MKFINYSIACLLYVCIFSCNEKSTTENQTVINAKDSAYITEDSVQKSNVNFDSLFASSIMFKKAYIWNEFDQYAKIPKNAICFKEKDFSGYSPYDIPFVGQAGDNIEEIIINNKKKIKIKDREVFFRTKIPLEFGYNRIPIKVINKEKKESEFYIEINIVEN